MKTLGVTCRGDQWGVGFGRAGSHGGGVVQGDRPLPMRQPIRDGRFSARLSACVLLPFFFTLSPSARRKKQINFADLSIS